MTDQQPIHDQPIHDRQPAHDRQPVHPPRPPASPPPSQAHQPPPAYLEELLYRIERATADDIHRFQPPPGADVRRSAVLVLMAETQAGPDVLLTERSATMRSQPGQVSFPGGSIDPEDADEYAAALREAREEVGIDTDTIAIHGRMPDLYIPVRRFAVAPVIGTAPHDYAIDAVNPHEVERAARVPLSMLADPEVRYTVTAPNGYRGPAFLVADLFVWGFTANVLDSVLRLGGFGREWDHHRTVPLPDRFHR